MWCCWLDIYDDLIGEDEFEDDADDEVPVVVVVVTFDVVVPAVPIDDNMDVENNGWNAAAAA